MTDYILSIRNYIREQTDFVKKHRYCGIVAFDWKTSLSFYTYTYSIASEGYMLIFNILLLLFCMVRFASGLGPMYSVLRYFGTRVPILQYSAVLGTLTFKKYLYSYLYSSTFKNESTFNEYLRVLYEY